MLALVAHDTDLIVSMTNGEPVALLDAIEDAARAGEADRPARASDASAARARQHGRRLPRPHAARLVLPLRRYPAPRRRGVEYVPANFSQVPRISSAAREAAGARLGRRARGAPALGTNGEYVAAPCATAFRASSRSTPRCRPPPARQWPTARRWPGWTSSARWWRPPGRSRARRTSGSPKLVAERSSCTARRFTSASAPSPTWCWPSSQIALRPARAHRAADRRDRRAGGEPARSPTRPGTRWRPRSPSQPRHLRLHGRQRSGPHQARRRGQRPCARDRVPAAHGLDLRHDRGRPLRAVRLGHHRRPLVLRLGRPARLHARRPHRRGWAGLHRPALDGQGHVAHQALADSRIGRDHRRALRRHGRHRVRRRRAARPQPRRARARPDRGRAPGLPRRARQPPRGPRA